MYSSRTKSPTIQFYSSLFRHNDKVISNRIRKLKLIISTEMTCCHLHFLRSSKLLDLFHISFFSLTSCFLRRVSWGKPTLVRGLELQEHRSAWVKVRPVNTLCKLPWRSRIVVDVYIYFSFKNRARLGLVVNSTPRPLYIGEWLGATRIGIWMKPGC